MFSVSSLLCYVSEICFCIIFLVGNICTQLIPPAVCKKCFTMSDFSRPVVKEINHVPLQGNELEDRKQHSYIYENKSYTTKGSGKLEKQKLIVFCDPKYPIKFIEPFLRFIKSYVSIFVTSHVHSSVQQFPDNLLTFCSEYRNSIQNAEIHLTIIWKTIGIDPIMNLSGMHKIIGQVNIARYINRVIENAYPHVLPYESKGVLYANEIDYYLEKIHSILHSNACYDIRKKSRYVMGENVSIVDIFLEILEKSKFREHK